MISEIDKGECICCKNTFPKIAIHHVDGNKENNEKSNLIPVCLHCHQLIHKGFKKRNLIDSKIKDRVFFLRKIILMEFNKYSEEYANDRIKYERAISSNYGCNKKCMLCRSDTHLKLYAPRFITRFDPTNKRNIGLVICKECSGEKKNISNLNFVSNISAKYK